METIHTIFYPISRCAETLQSLLRRATASSFVQGENSSKRGGGCLTQVVMIFGSVQKISVIEIFKPNI